MHDAEIGTMKEVLANAGIDLSILTTVLKALLLFIICYVVIKLLTKALSKLLDKGKLLDPSLKSFFKSAIKIVLWSIAVMVVASALGINITSLVALLSVAGVALSLALQGLLANVFSGITILINRPFAVGDTVTVSGRTGVVRSIGLFNTSILTLDNCLVHIPNGDITSSVIENGTAMEKRRISVSVETSYDCKTELVREALLEAAANSSMILEDPAPVAVLASFGASNIVYTVHAWCNAGDFIVAPGQLNEQIRESYERHGIDISYDRVIVSMQKD